MIKENVKFKCAVLTPERSGILQGAVFAVGGMWVDGSTRVSKKDESFLFCEGGVLSTCDTALFFTSYSVPEVTLQQALDILAAVEKPAPVFYIKPFDKILRRKAPGAQWEIGLYSHVHPYENHFVGLNNTTIPQLLKFEGNETLGGSTNAPMGWWEVGNGKPKWVTRK